MAAKLEQLLAMPRYSGLAQVHHCPSQPDQQPRAQLPDACIGSAQVNVDPTTGFACLSVDATGPQLRVACSVCAGVRFHAGQACSGMVKHLGNARHQRNWDASAAANAQDA